MNTPNPDFEALKDVTRLAWMLNFEAVATVANTEDMLARQFASEGMNEVELSLLARSFFEAFEALIGLQLG